MVPRTAALVMAAVVMLLAAPEAAISTLVLTGCRSRCGKSTTSNHRRTPRR